MRMAETESNTLYLCFSRCYSRNTFRHELLTDGSAPCYIQIVLQRTHGVTSNERKGNYDWELRNSHVDISARSLLGLTLN
jgi:hypothetical protein